MADYIVSNDFKTMEEIWDDLLRLHWDYLDTEENMEKLKMRRKLEDELKDFLSIVQHDRKFFLTETSVVFKQSVMKLDQYSAYKALMGFEAISQYANNLFRKPWRKEYRCIKLYSGYYQHEVKANLVDAEKLFEAMGYTLLPNHTLILEGPICPDQVTNVSRDAMTAYVECQIMKQIFQGLLALQLHTTWQEIFEFRETHIGNVAQAIKSMSYNIEKRRNRRDKLYECSYSSIAPLPVYSSSSSHNHVAFCNDQRHLMPSLPVSKTACNAYYSPSNVMCSSNCAAIKSTCSNNQFMHHSAIPHSKSLDHYNESNKFPEHHSTSRHSFDQTISTNYKHFDCIDGTNGCYYTKPAANYHPTNSRFPSISALPPYSEHHYAQIGGFDRGDNFIEPNIGTCCHTQNPHYDYPNNFNGRSSHQKPKNTDYSNCNFPSQ